MIKRALSIISLVCLILITATQSSSAQYYSWGSDVPSFKWEQIKRPDVSIIYPDTVDQIARRVLLYIDSVRADIDFGWSEPPLNIPFVIHPENFASNALVMWMPKRIDFLSTPSIESFSMPWHKQLVAHEYRHAVQYNNLNQGVVKWLSYILGEQGASAGLLFLPLPIIEGDAVKCETSMSTYGRGLQPSFTMGYRAIGREMLSRKNIDKWYCGSYLDYVPDHYQLGYQIVDYSYTRYNENIWDKVAAMGVRRPYYVATTAVALNKYYGLNNAKLMRATFNDLFDYWESLPERSNSTEIICDIDSSDYTTYSHPIPYGDGAIIALKSSYSDSERFVKVDPTTGSEQLLAHIGSLSTRPSLGGERLWWSEYRYSKLFLQRVNSQLCYMDLERNKPRTVRGYRQTLYPTAIGESNDHLAYVEYAPNGQYTIIEMRASDPNINRGQFEEVARTPIKFPTEVHSLAWDNKTNELYFIATDNSGMWIGVRDINSADGFRQLRKGAYITINSLRAKDGVLYFGSIESGYDEAHCYDIESDTEYRLTQSQYGSFNPSTPTSEGDIYATTYDKYGYHLSRQRVDLDRKVAPKETPNNVVNPKRTKWDIINLDTVDFTSIDSLRSHTKDKSRKYHKNLNLIKVHSWLPIAINPFNITSEQILDVTLGATAVSQNLLSSTEAYLSYGWSRENQSILSGSIQYTGLGVDLSADVTYGGDQILYTPFGNYIYTSDDKYQSYTLSATLPLYYQRGYYSRYLLLSTSWNWTNGLVTTYDDLSYDIIENVWRIENIEEGLHKLSFGATLYGSTKSATRDVASPWGYTLSASYTLSPTARDFSDLISIYAKISTPGFAPHNSLSLSANYQNSLGSNTNTSDYKMFSYVALLPRGFYSTDILNKNYLSASLNYQLPICYPEGGIGSILYLRRVRMNLGLDAARFDSYFSSGSTQTIYSYGGDLIFDINPLRMPSASTSSVQLSLYQPSVGSTYFTISLTLPF